MIVASEKLMGWVRDLNESVDIYVSSVVGVKSTDDVRRLEKYDISKITLHPDSARNFEDLKELIEMDGFKVELMVNLSCLRRCPRNEQHSLTMARNGDDMEFNRWCSGKKMNNPELFLNSNIIRPEDVGFYEDMGVDRFKLVGRAKSASWIPELVEAYMSRSFDGNLLHIIDCQDWLYIDNKAMDGFLEDYPRSDDIADEMEYCREWRSRLESDGDMEIDSEQVEETLSSWE